jgi:hypothetical protein
MSAQRLLAACTMVYQTHAAQLTVDDAHHCEGMIVRIVVAHSCNRMTGRCP